VVRLRHVLLLGVILEHILHLLAQCDVFGVQIPVFTRKLQTHFQRTRDALQFFQRRRFVELSQDNARLMTRRHRSIRDERASGHDAV